MKKHMMIHKDCSRTVHETFSCIYCTNIYLTTSGLKDHQQTVHSDKKPHECFCGIYYKSAAVLRYHINHFHNKLAQSTERTFICQTCGKGKKYL